MRTTPPKPGAPPASAHEGPAARLSKEERRELLAHIEREASRMESPERMLQRAEQALAGGQLSQAERLVAHIEQRSPSLLGLANLKARLAAAAKSAKLKANVRKAEEMLVRYLEERKKPAAELALEALSEIAPDHPQLEKYRLWVRDLDREAAVQRQLDEELAAGRAALAADDLDTARRRLEKLRQLAPKAAATAQLTAELSQAEAGQAENADIESIKKRLENYLATLRIAKAEAELELLAHHAVPKVTLDRLHLRLAEARAAQSEQRELATFEELFQQHLAAGQWQQARDVAQSAGHRFRRHPRPAAMFNEVNLRESEARHQESIRQGLAALEQFIARGQRAEAELALKLLRDKVDAAQLAPFEERVQAL